MMECNKDEVIKANEIARKKMENRDFFGAQKMARKAQQMYPMQDQEMMLAVCDVHCSAAQKVGTEMNWYSILQVEQTADELSIKRKFKKLCLLIHPDKNKFAGATDAFILIEEGKKVLTDQMKRSGYDKKYEAFTSTTKTSGQHEQPEPRSTTANRSSRRKQRHPQKFCGVQPQDNGSQSAVPEQNQVPDETNLPPEQSMNTQKSLVKTGGISEVGKRYNTEGEEDGNVNREDTKEDKEAEKTKMSRFKHVYVRTRRSSYQKQQVSSKRSKGADQRETPLKEDASELGSK